MCSTFLLSVDKRIHLLLWPEGAFQVEVLALPLIYFYSCRDVMRMRHGGSVRVIKDGLRNASTC